MWNRWTSKPPKKCFQLWPEGNWILISLSISREWMNEWLLALFWIFKYFTLQLKKASSETPKMSWTGTVKYFDVQIRFLDFGRLSWPKFKLTISKPCTNNEVPSFTLPDPAHGSHGDCYEASHARCWKSHFCAGECTSCCFYCFSFFLFFFFFV